MSPFTTLRQIVAGDRVRLLGFTQRVARVDLTSMFGLDWVELTLDMPDGLDVQKDWTGFARMYTGAADTLIVKES